MVNESSTRIDEEIETLETKYWQAMKDKDVEAALRLTHDPCIVTGSQGVASINREKFAQLMTGGDWTLKDFELSDMHVKMLDENVAVVAYKVHEELTVDGKPVAFDAADSSTWVRRSGRWLCVLHTEAPSGDPFGRDRRALKKGKSS